jgi:exopolyphosphatase/guanosine-5'-triphosphate,3'-diphosphate pyrophosphatase
MHDRLRFGAVDLGSNSVRCLAVSVSGGVLEYVASGVWISRVTEGIREGEYAVGGKALERTLEAVGKAFQLLERSGVTGGHISFCATESLRSAINSGEVVARMESLTGLTPRVLDPEEEARLGRKGASLGIPGAGWVFDLGGGSLDIGTPHRSFSFPLGAVRMTALFGEEPEAVMEEVRSVIGKSLEGGPGNLVGVGGTSSAAVMMLEMVRVDDYRPSRLHGRKVRSGDLDELARSVSATPLEERAMITGLEKGRADIIVTGLSVARALLGLMGVDEYTHSETDLLWALCNDMAAERGSEALSVRMP